MKPATGKNLYTKKNTTTTPSVSDRGSRSPAGRALSAATRRETQHIIKSYRKALQELAKH